MNDTGLKFEDYDILSLFYRKYVIFRSETIKFRTSQSDCFIGDSPLKGQNKGQIQYHERIVAQGSQMLLSDVNRHSALSARS